MPSRENTGPTYASTGGRSGDGWEANVRLPEGYYLPEGERMRDIMERLGEDGRVA